MPGLYDVLMEKEGKSQPPVPMGLWERLLGLFPGGPQDIELPNESGMVDPRIPPVGNNLMDAFRQTNEYAAGQGSPTERLRAAGLKAAGR